METPIRSKNCNKKECFNSDIESRNFVAPVTPSLKLLDCGTGVRVYRLERTPGKSPKSPWAVKKVLRTQDCKYYGDLLHYEASLLRQMNHPNIVGFRGFTKTDDGREVLAMEKCTLSLGNMIEERYEEKSKMFRAEEILKVCLNVAKALDYLHNEVMLMHADIKSYNILINGNFDEVKLCDFGVSIKVDEEGKAMGKYIGTGPWTAPEALYYDRVVTTKADIFSLGLVIYEMMALIPPHSEDVDDNSDLGTGDSEEYVDYEENFGKRPELPAFLPDKKYNLVVDIYNLCTEENPEKRPSAKQLVNTIEEMIKHAM